MAIGIFRRTYTLRRFGEQTITDGYADAPYTEITVRLNVQPLSANELKALPEGERTIKRVKAFGAAKLISADKTAQRPGDWLFCDGEWYECRTCVHWLHTPLHHCEAEFVLLEQQPPQEVDGNDAEQSQ